MDNGIKNILESIKQDTELILLKEKENTKIKIEKLQENYKNEKNKFLENTDNSYNNDIKLEKERILSKLENQGKTQVLLKKQEIISEILSKVNERIDNIEDDVLLEYINKKIDGISKDYRLIIPKKYENIQDKINFKNIVVKEIPVGFLLEKDGVIENYTLTSKIEYTRDDIEILISKEIF